MDKFQCGKFKLIFLTSFCSFSSKSGCVKFCGEILTISKMRGTPPRWIKHLRPTLRSYLFILNFLIILHMRATFEGYCY